MAYRVASTVFANFVLIIHVSADNSLPKRGFRQRAHVLKLTHLKILKVHNRHRQAEASGALALCK